MKGRHERHQGILRAIKMSRRHQPVAHSLDALRVDRGHHAARRLGRHSGTRDQRLARHAGQAGGGDHRHHRFGLRTRGAAVDRRKALEALDRTHAGPRRRRVEHDAAANRDRR